MEFKTPLPEQPADMRQPQEPQSDVPTMEEIRNTERVCGEIEALAEKNPSPLNVCLARGMRKALEIMKAESGLNYDRLEDRN